jgi:ATP-dependent exoDNAse (exonuclease V) alpha subunit
MIETAIIEMREDLTKTQLWKKLPKKMQYQTFKRALDYLEASNKIVYNDGIMVYTGANSEKLKALIDSAVKF